MDAQPPPETTPAASSDTHDSGPRDVQQARRRVGRALIPAQDADVVLVDATPSARPVPVDTRDYVRFSPDAATRVRVLAGDTVALDLWCVEPQQSTGVMQFPDSDAVYTVVGGRSWFVTEEGDVGLDPLGALWVPAGTVHGIDNRGTDPLIVSVAMSPPDDREADDADGPGAAIRDPRVEQTVGQRLRGGLGRLFGP